MPGGDAGLGIDFGTSNTVAVLRLPDGRRQSLLFDGSPMLPSAVYAEPAESAYTLLTGRDALYSARLEPSRFEPNPKRRIDEGLVLMGDVEIPATVLVAAVLERVAQEAVRVVGSTPRDVVVTYPADWGASRRLLLTDAAEQAGLGVVRLVPEPVAAATYFVEVLGQEVAVGSGVLVHDFGAGTFDASVVLRTENGFETVAVDGRDDTGGLDVDAAIVDHLGELYAGRSAEAWDRIKAPQTTSDRRHRRALWDDVRLAKERLSRHSSAGIVLPILEEDALLTRNELDALAKPLIDRTVRMTQSVLRFSRLPDDRIAGVFLVGGGSRMPLVSTMLHRALGIAPTALEQPELVVAEGALSRVTAVEPAQGSAGEAVTLPEPPTAPVRAPAPPAVGTASVVGNPPTVAAAPAEVSAAAARVEVGSEVSPGVRARMPGSAWSAAAPPDLRHQPSTAPHRPAAAPPDVPHQLPGVPPSPAAPRRSAAGPTRRRVLIALAVLWPTALTAIGIADGITQYLFDAAAPNSVFRVFAFLVGTLGPPLVAGIVATAILRPRLGRIATAGAIVLTAGVARALAVATDALPDWATAFTAAAHGVALALAWLLIRGRPLTRLWIAAFAAVPLWIARANADVYLWMSTENWYWKTSVVYLAGVAVVGWIAAIPWKARAQGAAGPE